jgi:hypothetical protein
VFPDDTESFIPDDQPDPLLLFACAVAWRVDRDLDAGWELIHATKAVDAEARALARDLLMCVAGYSRPARPPSISKQPVSDTADSWSYAPRGFALGD